MIDWRTADAQDPAPLAGLRVCVRERSEPLAGPFMPQRLVQLGADVIVESFRPGVIARLGLNWPRLQRRNPRLLLASLSGYGSTGPCAQWPGHDIHDLAAAGVAGMA